MFFSEGLKPPTSHDAGKHGKTYGFLSGKRIDLLIELGWWMYTLHHEFLSTMLRQESKRFPLLCCDMSHEHVFMCIAIAQMAAIVAIYRRSSPNIVGSCPFMILNMCFLSILGVATPMSVSLVYQHVPDSNNNLGIVPITQWSSAE